MAIKKSRIFLYLRFLILFLAKRQPHKPAMTKSWGDSTFFFFFTVRLRSIPYSFIFLTVKVLLSYDALFTHNFGSFQSRTF